MAVLEIIVFFFYAGWMILSMLAQGKSRLNRPIRRFDLFILIPNFRFFCPSPVKEDFHLYYRKRGEDLTWNEWTELRVGEKNPWICFVWNPRRRDRKIFFHTAKVLTKYFKKSKPEQMMKGHIFRLLLETLQQETAGVEGTALEFKITGKQDYALDSEEKILFTSPVCPCR